MQRSPLDLHALAIMGFLLTVLGLLLLMCLMPVFFVAAMQQALERLHLTPMTALLVVLLIVVGSFVNIPVYRVERPSVVVEVRPPFPWPPFLAPVVRTPDEVVIAINFGGGVVPTALAIFELVHLAFRGPGPFLLAMAATGITALVCFLVARPVPGLGVVVPLLVPPVVALLATWALFGFSAPPFYRAPAAFVAGVLGTLAGADLLHLPRVLTMPVNLVVIGGAGTFDGIVLSGILAALLA